MSVGEYYARKADMYETLMSGHDSKESQTQGNADLLISWHCKTSEGVCTKTFQDKFLQQMQEMLEVKKDSDAVISSSFDTKQSK